MITSKTLLCILFLSAVGIYKTFAQEASSVMEFSLTEAHKFALNNSTSVKNAMIDIALAEKKVWETTAIGLPNVSGNISYQNIFTVPVMNMAIPELIKDQETGEYSLSSRPSPNPLELGTKENLTYKLTASQLVFSGEYIVGLQASRTYKQLSKQNLEKSRTDIKSNVSQAYYLILVLEENIHSLEASLKNLEKTAYEMEQMLRVGFIEDTDVDQIKLTKLILENTVSNLQRQIELAYRNLKFQMGIPLNKEIMLTDKLESAIEDANIQTLISTEFNVGNNIDFKLMDTQEKLQELSLKREKSTILPSIMAVYMHQELANEPDFNMTPPDVINISMDIPLFASGTRHVKIQQASLELEKVKNSKQEAARGLLLQHEQLQSELLAAFEKYNSEKQSMEISQKIYDKTFIKYKEGVSTSMELTQSQNQLLEAQSNYYTAILEYLGAYTQMKKLLSKE